MSRAQQLAEYLETGHPNTDMRLEAADLLRQQDEMLTLQGKVLRQLVDALEDAHYTAERHQDVIKREAALAAAKECYDTDK